MPREFTTWVEISKSKIQRNINHIRNIIGDSMYLMTVLKSNAYGSGIPCVVESTKKQVDWYGVISVHEANAVRVHSDKPILILGHIPESDVPEVIEKGYSVLVYSKDMLRTFSRHAPPHKKVKIHVKIDIGLTRLGLLVGDINDFIHSLSRESNIQVEGVCTHFARLMDSGEKDIYEEQLNIFRYCVKLLYEAGFCHLIQHAASSMPTVLYKNTHLNMVRIGALTYGLWGKKSMIDLVKRKGKSIKPEPVLTWKTTVMNIKKVPAGTSIGYMNSVKVKKNTKIAVIGVGYYDGLDRRYAEAGHILINGVLARFLGKIAMNMCVVDITNVPGVKVGDVVIIIGQSGENIVTAYDMAELLNTSTYEVTSRINPLIPRVLI